MDNQTNNNAEVLEEIENEDMLKSEDAKKIIENLLFITDRPLTVKRITEVVEGVNAADVMEIITGLQKEYSETGRAIQILDIAGGFQMSTKPEYGRWVRKLYNEKMTAKLSNAALETLAIIAYKQPVTRAEVEAIRGVDIAGPLEKLLERGLVKILGKRDTIGKPMVYGTTDEFLRLFGLNKVSDLPDMDIFAAKTAPVTEEADLPFENGGAILPLEEDGEEIEVFVRETFEEESCTPVKNEEPSEFAAQQYAQESEVKEAEDFSDDEEIKDTDEDITDTDEK
ncbi:Segregation and condensation protein [Elusimicrobium minutum Pei191]|uniref:Segregation and condensation protein n=1 Tax=Elusimicrobium minutum (strain Pei191) TaxID=445932 RepID=B2KE26_ELUMP|nr:SMC-Scp complex subunit ScpB [Elusimicrobium minutum]ACC98772.1 Segregation and condensation protein [Elusimicrobium minutum Pei191]